jgi:hypothetical protein
MTKQSWVAIGAATIALAIVCTLAWWAYRESQQRELQQEVVAVVQDCTARLRQALELLTAGPAARAELEAHYAALEGSVERTQALDASIHPALVQVAHAYVTEVHALLRRQLALHAGRDGVRADIDEIDSHLRTAAMRSPEWIGQALALKQRLEKSFFHYRLAAGGLEKSLHSLDETSLKLRTFVPPAAIIEPDPISSAQRRLLELSTQVGQQVEGARKLPSAG